VTVVPIGPNPRNLWSGPPTPLQLKDSATIPFSLFSFFSQARHAKIWSNRSAKSIRGLFFFFFSFSFPLLPSPFLQNADNHIGVACVRASLFLFSFFSPFRVWARAEELNRWRMSDSTPPFPPFSPSFLLELDNQHFESPFPFFPPVARPLGDEEVTVLMKIAYSPLPSFLPFFFFFAAFEGIGDIRAAFPPPPFSLLVLCR